MERSGMGWPGKAPYRALGEICRALCIVRRVNQFMHWTFYSDLFRTKIKGWNETRLHFFPMPFQCLSRGEKEVEFLED